MLLQHACMVGVMLNIMWRVVKNSHAPVSESQSLSCKGIRLHECTREVSTCDGEGEGSGMNGQTRKSENALVKGVVV